MAGLLHYFTASFFCNSLVPQRQNQRVMSRRATADDQLVVEVCKMLADHHRRQPDEIQLIGIAGINDATQIWPKPVSVEAHAAGGESGEMKTSVTGEPINVGTATGTPSPGWTPADRPLSDLPTIEEANRMQKPAMIELARKLKIEFEDSIKFPDLRNKVLGVLLARQTSAEEQKAA